jgi:hypothetical protein
MRADSMGRAHVNSAPCTSCVTHKDPVPKTRVPLLSLLRIRHEVQPAPNHVYTDTKHEHSQLLHEAAPPLVTFG